MVFLFVTLKQNKNTEKKTNNTDKTKHKCQKIIFNVTLTVLNGNMVPVPTVCIVNNTVELLH